MLKEVIFSFRFKKAPYKKHQVRLVEIMGDAGKDFRSLQILGVSVEVHCLKNGKLTVISYYVYPMKKSKIISTSLSSCA